MSDDQTASEVCITNHLGDVVEIRQTDGTVRSVDPSTWGWLRADGANDPGERRRPVGSLIWLPGFTLSEGEEIQSFVPGPKLPGSWMEWRPGHAPAAAVETSDAGGGTRAYFDRISDAAGHVADALPRRRRTNRAPRMELWDFVAGRLYRVAYKPTGTAKANAGRVYLLDDGVAVKVGFTTGPVAVRVNDLQTGNPRPISVMAEIVGATVETELALHDELSEANVSGEWFARQAVVDRIWTAGSVEQWLRTCRGVGRRRIDVHPPYR